MYFIHYHFRKIFSRTTIPQGKWKWLNDTERYPEGAFKLEYTFDFFNYAGVHRPVTLLARPKTLYIKDISVSTQSVQLDANHNKKAVIKYNVETSISEENSDLQCTIQIMDHKDELQYEFNDCRATSELDDVSCQKNITLNFILHLPYRSK